MNNAISAIWVYAFVIAMAHYWTTGDGSSAYLWFCMYALTVWH